MFPLRIFNKVRTNILSLHEFGVSSEWKLLVFSSVCSWSWELEECEFLQDSKIMWPNCLFSAFLLFSLFTLWISPLTSQLWRSDSSGHFRLVWIQKSMHFISYLHKPPAVAGFTPKSDAFNSWNLFKIMENNEEKTQTSAETSAFTSTWIDLVSLGGERRLNLKSYQFLRKTKRITWVFCNSTKLRRLREWVFRLQW